MVGSGGRCEATSQSKALDERHNRDSIFCGIGK